MSKENLFKGLSVVLGLALIITLVILFSNKSVTPIGGTTHNVSESFDAGISVNGTPVISSSRAITATTGTFSGAISGTTINGTTITGKAGTLVNGTANTLLAVGSSAITTNVGKICVWNGSEYAVMTFSAATPSYATSTTCQ